MLTQQQYTKPDRNSWHYCILYTFGVSVEGVNMSVFTVLYNLKRLSHEIFNFWYQYALSKLEYAWSSSSHSWYKLLGTILMWWALDRQKSVELGYNVVLRNNASQVLNVKGQAYGLISHLDNCSPLYSPFKKIIIKAI